MAKCTIFIYFLLFLLRFTWAVDDRIYFDPNYERRWNTPPELISQTSRKEDKNSNTSPQARFLPFSASFTLNAGSSNAHSLSVGSSDEGISLSQSQSSNSSPFGNGSSGISASQSTSFSAGLSGISASDANAFNLNHPIFGGNSKANSNSFTIGQATSMAHGKVVNNQAITGAHSSVGSPHSLVSSSASSSAGNHQTSSAAEATALAAHHGQGHQREKPSWMNIRPNYPAESIKYPCNKNEQNGVIDQRFTSTSSPWSQHSQEKNPSLQISGASASSSSSSNTGGFSFGQSSSQSNIGSSRPSSWTNNRVHTTGDAQSHAQGAAAAVGQHSNGKTQGSFSSGAISASSAINGQSQGTSISENRGQSSRGEVISHSAGVSNVQGTANAGSVSFVRFPEGENDYNVPKEFVRSGLQNRKSDQQQNRSRKQQRNPIDRFLTDLTDTVVDIFDFK